MWKNVHLVYGTGIRTHDLQSTSLLSLPLDQGSRPASTLYTYLALSSSFYIYVYLPPFELHGSLNSSYLPT